MKTTAEIYCMEKLGKKYNSAVVAIIQCNGGKLIFGVVSNIVKGDKSLWLGQEVISGSDLYLIFIN